MKLTANGRLVRSSNRANCSRRSSTGRAAAPSSRAPEQVGLAGGLPERHAGSSRSIVTAPADRASCPSHRSCDRPPCRVLMHRDQLARRSRPRAPMPVAASARERHQPPSALLAGLDPFGGFEPIAGRAAAARERPGVDDGRPLVAFRAAPDDLAAGCSGHLGRSAARSSSDAIRRRATGSRRSRAFQVDRPARPYPAVRADGAIMTSSSSCEVLNLREIRRRGPFSSHTIARWLV